MGDPTPTTSACKVERSIADKVTSQAKRPFSTWPGNLNFTPPLTFNPKTRAELANAVLAAEAQGLNVRAFGSRWSFSDAIQANAMIATEHLNRSLNDLPIILAAGIDRTHLHLVEAGMKASDLVRLLDNQGQMLEAGGASDQSVAGMISTSTHSADSSVPPFVEYVRAIHLVGAGGIEHWIERDSPITDPNLLVKAYPCLARGNIHYDTALFDAVLVAAGTMGVIYSVIVEAVPTYGVKQHRVATTWEQLLKDDPSLARVTNGSYMKSLSVGWIDVLGSAVAMKEPFSPNTFSQIVINPYPFYANDASLSPQAKAKVGEHLCFITNRVRLPNPPVPPVVPPPLVEAGFPDRMMRAALDALGGNPAETARFLLFGQSVQGKKPDEAVIAAVDFLADNYAPGTISAVIRHVLVEILPRGEFSAVNLSEVAAFGAQIHAFGFEAAFSVSGAVAFVNSLLPVVQGFALRRPQSYIGGYLSLRIVGQRTTSLLGPQKWSPTCHVEYIGVSGTRGMPEFLMELQRLAIRMGGVLHLGLMNDVMTAADFQNAHGAAAILAFRHARGRLTNNATLSTFDNVFTKRLNLGALPS
jgi:hypothetical protein